jgi:ABC-2 type transport system ATP-binding protein
MLLGGREILPALDLQVSSGEFVGLVGANGCGKSTLMRCIAGVLTPTAGEILICGVSMLTMPDLAKAGLGYAADPGLLPPELTGRQCLELIAGARDAALTPELLALADALRFSPWLDRVVGQYSLGTRQKLAVLMALIGTPPLVLLDEVLNGLDFASAAALKAHLVSMTRSGSTVILATHALEGAQNWMTRLLLMDAGRLTHDWGAGTLATLANTRPGRSFEQAVVDAITVDRA